MAKTRSELESLNDRDLTQAWIVAIECDTTNCANCSDCERSRRDKIDYIIIAG